MSGRRGGRNRGCGLGAGLGLAGGYVLAQQAWGVWQLIRSNPEHTLSTQANEAPKGLTFSETDEDIRPDAHRRGWDRADRLRAKGTAL